VVPRARGGGAGGFFAGELRVGDARIFEVDAGRGTLAILGWFWCF